MAKRSSIIYINYFPYENAGHILDYLLDNYQLVILFSIGFHELGYSHKSNVIKMYKHKKLIASYPLYQIAVPKSLVFFFLPIKSILIFVQILFHAHWMKYKYGTFDHYFTVNAFTAWIGNLLRNFGVVKETTFWVWDYYPPIHNNKLITLARWVYWQFDKKGTDSNRTVFMNSRLINLRKNIGILNHNKKYVVVPIGTKPIRKHKLQSGEPVKMIFYGVLKKSQGINLLLNAFKSHKLKNVELHIIGSGPDYEYFKKICIKLEQKIKFWGYIDDDKTIDKIMSSCDIGVATYLPEKGNVSYYGDPSKIKKYLSLALPVITTDVFVFSQEIIKSNAGIIIRYNQKELISAISTIKNKYKSYSKNSLKLAKSFEYNKIYKQLLK